MEISVNVFTTLDGVMQGPGGPEEDTSGGFDRGGWLVPFAGDAWGHVVDGWFKRGDAILLGRTTFEAMRSYWPQVTDDEDGVAKALNRGKKFLVSTTLSDDEARWGDTTVIREDVLDRIADLKEHGQGELQVHGSWQLAHSLHVAGLVDVFRILQFPVVLGSGKRLFGDSTPTGFDVLDASVLPGGVVSFELRQTSHGSTAVGEYAVRDGKEVVV